MSNKSDYVIFTDTDTDITPEVAKTYGYELISMPYNINGKDYFPYVDFDVFDSHKFYDDLRHGTMPTTAGLSPATYENYFEPFFKAGKDILYVHFSKAMSGTFNAMNIAIKNLQEKYPDRKFYTVDTKGITICSYNIVKEIGDLYLQGKSAEEICEWAKTEVDKFAIYFFANDLSFFKRSGRVKSFTAFMGNMFGVRPIINMGEDGMMKSVSTARGLKATLDKIMDYVDNLQENIMDHRVIIGHTDALDIAKLLANKMYEKYGTDLKIEFVEVNPTAGSHCGPDGVGICFHAKGR